MHLSLTGPKLENDTSMVYYREGKQTKMQKSDVRNIFPILEEQITLFIIYLFIMFLIS